LIRSNEIGALQMLFRAFGSSRKGEIKMSIDKRSAGAPETALRHSVGYSRRNVLQCATVIAAGSAAIAMSATALAADTGTAKLSQQAAAYQTSPKNGQRCTDCALFIAPASCKLVDGAISPAGWCKLFSKKT
jgi:hypothetical protein